MVKNSVSLCVLVLISVFKVAVGHSDSPCPNIFEFVTDGEYEFGQITLRPVETQAQLKISISFTVQADLGEYLGRIVAPKDILDKYNRGETVTYRVYFPIIKPRPKVTEISLNGQILCTGPGDKPTSFTTTRTISHPTLHFTNYYVGAPPPYKRFNQQESTMAPPQTTPGPTPKPTSRLTPRPTARPTPRPTAKPTLRPTPMPVPEGIQKSNKDYALAFAQNINHHFGSSENAISPYHPFVVEAQTWKPRPTVPPKLENPRPATNKPRPRQDDRYTNECGVVAGGNQIQELVYNGRSYERGQIPWLVAIFKVKRKGLEFLCGGTLVSDRHVVTAAHCKQSRSTTTSNSDIVVKLGVHNLADWGDDLSITTMIMNATMHESYNGFESLRNDIMVLTLSRRIKFNRYIRPACLWSANTELERVVGDTGVVAGWGDGGDRNNYQLDEPQLVRIPIVSDKECRASNAAFHTITYNTTFCAGDRHGASPCTGDSGGGLYLLEGGKWRLRGVVSLSLQSTNLSCNLDEYVVFTDTAQYLPWIRNILSQKYYD